MKPKTGTSMGKVINVRNKQRELKAVEANCKKCLYYPRGRCKFGLSPEKGMCFKFELYIKPAGGNNNPQIMCKLCNQMISWDRKRDEFRKHLHEIHQISDEEYNMKFRY